jgi:hypothetical protein
MPKNSDKYRYFQVGIGWESWTLKQLEGDATLHQMEDQPAKLIALRLTEYYKLAEMGVFVPGVTARMRIETPSPSAANGHSKAYGDTAAPSPYVDLKEEEAPQSPTNPIDDSADYWGTLDS